MASIEVPLRRGVSLLPCTPARALGTRENTSEGMSYDTI